MTWVLVAAAGAAGAVARHAAGVLLGGRALPVATLAVNLVGSFLLGLLLSAGAPRLSPHVTTALAAGFLGAFTTFSAFAHETAELVRSGRAPAAAAYVAASVVVGVLAAAAGWWAGEALRR